MRKSTSVQRLGCINQKLTLRGRRALPWVFCKKQGDEAMFRKMAKGAYVLFVAAMVVAWAVSAGKSSPAEPKNDAPVVWNWNI
jgi:hypothetical protein